MVIKSYHNTPDAHNSHTSWHLNYVGVLKHSDGISKDDLTQGKGRLDALVLNVH